MKKFLKMFLLLAMNQRGEVGEGGEPDPAPTPDPGGEPDPGGSLLGGGEPDPAPTPDPGATPPAGGNDHQTQEQLKAIWGDLADKIEWPEGMPDDVKLSPSIKPFVTKEGKLNHAELAKSYIHTKKKVGEKGIQVPTEQSPQQEWDEYFQKVGWSPEIEGYELKAPEGSELTEESLESFKKLFHENRVPLQQAQKILENIDQTTKTSLDSQTEKLQAEITEGVQNLKKEWGEAFDSKLTMSKKVLKENGSEDLQKMLAEDPSLGSNPHLIKFLHGIGEKMYGEDSIPSRGGVGDGALSPSEASQEINAIIGNGDDPYHKPGHPAHNDRVKHVQRLFQYKNVK